MEIHKNDCGLIAEMPHIILDPEEIISEMAERSIPLQERSSECARKMEVFSLEAALAECSTISLNFLEHQGQGFQFTGNCTTEVATEPLFYNPAFIVPTDIIIPYCDTLCFIVESDDAPTGVPPLYRRPVFFKVESPRDMTSSPIAKIRFDRSTEFWEKMEFKSASGLSAHQVKSYMLSVGCLRLTDRIGLVSFDGKKALNIIGREMVRDLADSQYLLVQTEFAERMVLFSYVGAVTGGKADEEGMQGKRYYSVKTPPIRQYARPPVLLHDDHYDLSPEDDVRWH
jgi:hypothetical protein